MPDSAVIVAMRSFKRDLLRQESAQMREMATRWLQVERRLSGDMAALAAEMHDIAEGGGIVSSDLLFDHRRYRLLMRQLTDELGTYTRYADRTITDKQAQLARLGIDHAVSAIEAQGVRAGFARLPVEAVQNMVGLAGNGTPLRTLLTATWPDAAEGLTQQLIRGVALGWNPRKTAKAMAQGNTRSLDRMMVISRSESLRVYRSANLASYRSSGVVSGYRRLAARSNRTCLSCLVRDGEFIDLKDEMDEHPAGRCTSVPIVIGVPEPTWQVGKDWLIEQPEKTQLAVMGKERLGLWKSGRYDLEEMIRVIPNETWGNSLGSIPLRELV